MSEPFPDDSVPQRALADGPKKRSCLRCKTPFLSEGFGERICKRCKGSNTWKNAAPAHQRTSRRP